VTSALIEGTEGRPGLAALVTARSGGSVNLKTAEPLILRALGLADAEINEIEQARRGLPYTAVPGRFAGRGLTITTRTFRVEAEGLIDGRTRARLTAIVQKRMEGNTPAIVVLEWSGAH